MPTPDQHAVLAPSAAHRWLNCTASIGLCKDMPDEPSEAAAEGTLAHSLGELKLRALYGDPKPTKKAFNSELKKIEKDPLYKPEMQHTTDEYVKIVQSVMEQFVTYTIYIEARLDMRPTVPQCYGTGDCVIVGQLTDGTWMLVVIDYKHGKGVPVSAENNPQLKLYALGALLKVHNDDTLNNILTGEPIRQIDVIQTRIVQPRTAEGNSEFTLTRDELIDWVTTEVQPAAQKALDGSGECVPGPWCRNGFCPIRNTCRPRAKHVLAVMFDDRALADKKTLTPDEIGELLSLTEELVPWRKGLSTEAWKMAQSGQAVSGWKLVRGRADRVWSNPVNARKVLSDAGFKAKDITSAPELLSPAQIEGLLGKEKFAELLGAVVTKGEARPTLAPESDRREALEAGKAIHCKTEDEARRLFEVMGWKKDDAHKWLPYPCTCYGTGIEDYEFGPPSEFEVEGREVVPLSTLTRSRLAEALGVEDGQEFMFRGSTYSVRDIGHGYRVYIHPHVVDAGWEKIYDMINHPSEIHPCPVWSEESVKAARAAEVLNFKWATKSNSGLVMIHEAEPRLVDGVWVTSIGSQIPLSGHFYELRPGQTVALGEIR